MNPRQRHALLHPLNYAENTAEVVALREVHRHRPTGLIISTILAVDR